MKTLIGKVYSLPFFFAALFIMDVIWKQPNCPLMGRLMDKEDVIHTHTHTHTHKEKSLLADTAWSESRMTLLVLSTSFPWEYTFLSPGEYELAEQKHLSRLVVCRYEEERDDAQDFR